MKATRGSKTVRFTPSAVPDTLGEFEAWPLDVVKSYFDRPLPSCPVAAPQKKKAYWRDKPLPPLPIDDKLDTGEVFAGTSEEEAVAAKKGGEDVYWDFDLAFGDESTAELSERDRGGMERG